jgi:hypothetical protein
MQILTFTSSSNQKTRSVPIFQQALKENNMVNDMRKEYDFSQGERGKFFAKDAKFNLPVYLEDEVFTYIEGIAKKRKTDISTIVNQLLRSDIQLVEAIK